MLINKPDKIFPRRNVTIAGMECTLERKNTRRLHIYIKPPDGEVLVTAPFLYTEREIKAFVESKADWIRKHQERLRGRSSQARMALDYASDETLFFWGKPYDLTVVEEAGRKRGKIMLDPEPVFGVGESELIRFRTAGRRPNRQALNDTDLNGYDAADDGLHGKAVLVVPAGSTREQREQLVRRKYKELLEPATECVLAFWSEQTGLKYSSWHSRYMKSRWGSLSVRDRRVCLNIRLAEKPEICLVYVALHEIAHVKEANHGPRFKAILNEYMPSWHDAEKILKS